MEFTAARYRPIEHRLPAQCSTVCHSDPGTPSAILYVSKRGRHARLAPFSARHAVQVVTWR
jgi:hypothetical protein